MRITGSHLGPSAEPPGGALRSARHFATSHIVISASLVYQTHRGQCGAGSRGVSGETARRSIDAYGTDCHSRGADVGKNKSPTGVGRGSRCEGPGGS